MSGWVKLHRSLLEWEWYDDANATRLLIHLLVSVNYEQKVWHGITVNPGTVITSFEKLAKETGLTLKQVRLALDKLENSGETARKRADKGQAITLVKWEKMQSDEEKRASKRADEGQIEGRQRATTKERKNIRIKEIKNIFSQKVFQTFDEVIKQFPLNLHPKNKDSWLKVIDELIRIDKIPPEIIIEVTKKARQDSFWQSNFLSITKLRKKNPEQIPYIVVFYEKFLKQKTNGNTTTNNKKHGTTEDELAAILADHFDKQRRGVRD